MLLRGYLNQSLSSISGDPLYNKYNMELRYPISLNPNSTIYALMFAEAGNSWENYDNYNPFELKKSTGLGIRIFMPMFGLLGLDFAYGYMIAQTLPLKKWMANTFYNWTAILILLIWRFKKFTYVKKLFFFICFFFNLLM